MSDEQPYRKVYDDRRGSRVQGPGGIDLGFGIDPGLELDAAANALNAAFAAGAASRDAEIERLRGACRSTVSIITEYENREVAAGLAEWSADYGKTMDEIRAAVPPAPNSEGVGQ